MTYHRPFQFRLEATVFAALCLSAVGAVHGENWPQFRGPAGTGVSGETEIPIIWSESRGLAWKSPVPAGSSSPAVWERAVFVTGQVEDELQLLRFDLADGKLAWKQTVGRAELAKGDKGVHPQAGPSPVTDGRYVVASFSNGDLAACDFSGKLLWKRNLQEDHGPFLRTTGRTASPVIFGETVICTCIQSSPANVVPRPAESYLAAYSLTTGTQRWKTPRKTKAVGEQADADTTPVIVRVDELDQLLVLGGNQLDAYDPATGKQIWFLPNLTGGRTVAGPTVGNGMVYAARGGKRDTFALKAGGEGELPRRSIAWERADSSPETCSPVVWGEWLFTITDDGNVCCRHAASGNSRWKHRLPGTYQASPIVTEGRLFFLNTEGLCTVLSAAPYYDKLTENRLDEEFTATPAISGGRILLRGRKALYCIAR